MSFLERTKRAAEQARQAATEKAGQARLAAAEAADQAKHVATEARQVATEAAVQARQATIEVTERTQATLRDPATKEKARETLRQAKRGMATALERIDPSVLADVIIKATILQEKANAALRAKGSPYRIAEIAIGASIPPSISFSIGRLDDPDADPALHAAVGAPEHPAEPDGTFTTLDGAKIDETDLAELGE